MNIRHIETMAEEVELSYSTRSLIENSRLEFRITNPEMGVKYVQFSEELALATGITESADILPIADEGLIIVAKELPFHSACTVTLQDAKGAKVAYNSALVDLLVEDYWLEFFEGSHQRLFTDITIETLTNQTTAAFIRIFYTD